MNHVEIIYQPILQCLIILAIFIALTLIGDYFIRHLRKSDSRFLNPQEFLPEDEIHTLKQIFYLILMALCFVNVLYAFIGTIHNGLLYFEIFDIVLSLYIAITLDKSSLKNKILFLILVPYGAMGYFMLGFTVLSIIDFIHIPVFIYFIKYYYDKFKNYTESHGLTVAIVLLFVIIFVSFFLTQIAEQVNPLDSLVMVSNAFTSNGYAVLGQSVAGKINSLFLVWGGYIISGAGTATLTAAILIKKFNKRIEELEEIIVEGSGEND